MNDRQIFFCTYSYDWHAFTFLGLNVIIICTCIAQIILLQVAVKLLKGLKEFAMICSNYGPNKAPTLLLIVYCINIFWLLTSIAADFHGNRTQSIDSSSEHLSESRPFFYFLKIKIIETQPNVSYAQLRLWKQNLIISSPLWSSPAGYCYSYRLSDRPRNLQRSSGGQRPTQSTRLHPVGPNMCSCLSQDVQESWCSPGWPPGM